MVRTFSIILDAIVLATTVTINWMMPSLTRRDLLFGVTVAPDARTIPAGQAILRRYRLQVLGVGLLCAALLAVFGAFAPQAWWNNGWSSLFVLVIILLMTVPYLLAYFASLALRVSPQAGAGVAGPAATPVAELRPRHYAEYVPLFWEVLPLAIIAATAIALAISYAAAPAVIPVHFDVAGHPNRYATKTIGSYFFLVWVQLGLEVFLTGIALLIVGSKALPGRAESQFRRWWLRYLFGVKVATLAFFGVLAAMIAQAAQTGNASSIGKTLPFSLGYVVILLVGALALAIRTGQGGARLGNPAETASDRIDDRYWKLGTFYVNPRDPSFFVEKRFGVGWTINFGNRWSVLALCGLLALAVLVPLLSLLLRTR